MIAFMFQHEMREAPYQQRAVKSAFARLEALCKEWGESYYYAFGHQRDRIFRAFEDELILVYHTCPLAPERKAALVEQLRTLTTLRKSDYPDEKPAGAVLFRKVEDGDCYPL